MSSYKSGVKKAHLGGIAFGLSESMGLLTFSIQFLCAAYFVLKFNSNPVDLIIAINIVRFANFAIGQAS